MEAVACPNPDQIHDLLRGNLDEPLATTLTIHVSECPACIVSCQSLKDYIEAVDSHGSAPSKSIEIASGFNTTLEEEDYSFLEPSQQPDEIGRLANYRVLKILGVGGMGIVMHAEDTILERAVALKAIKSSFSRDASIRERFLFEAKAMARVKSDHIVTVHQIGQHNDTGFIAMELLQGDSLERLLETRGFLTIDEVLNISMQTARALADAHQAGLIHRDIKPANVWIEMPGERVKLLDFGLARQQKADVKLTGTGFIMGTPAYMSPEQANAMNLDERSDIFSMGCMMYEMISGVQPFETDVLSSTLLAITTKTPPPPSHYNSKCPEILDHLILYMLEKQPAHRPANAQEVIEHLSAIGSKLLYESEKPSVQIQRRAKINSTDLFNSGALSASSIIAPGTSQAGDTREAERRQVTVLACSCDLLESEEFLEQLSTEERTRINQAFQQACTSATLNNKGTVVQCSAERFLACFGYPIAFEDAAQRAIWTALELMKQLKSKSKQIAQKYNLELDPRLIIHTGPAVLETNQKVVSLVGEARNVCLKLLDCIDSGVIVCSEQTQSVLRNRFDCSSIGSANLKKSKDKIALFQVNGVTESKDNYTNSGPMALNPLVGRDHEIHLLLDRWKQTVDGQGQSVLIVGEAGLGKSHLVYTAKEKILSSNKSNTGINGYEVPMVIDWQSSPSCQNTSLHPVKNYFRRQLNRASDDSSSALSNIDRLVSYLETFGITSANSIALFSALLGLPPDDRYPSLALTPVREREEIFNAIIQWLQICSEKQPVLFILEDLQWLDASSIELLERILPEIKCDRILTLATSRPYFQSSLSTLFNQTSFALNRLTKQQTSDMLSTRIGGSVDPEIVDKVFERSDGIPLFVEEFAKMMQERDMPNANLESLKGNEFKTLMTREVPATLTDLIMARLDRITDNREVAQVAATIGREFGLELLAEVSGLNEISLETELQKLVQGGILFKKGRTSTYIFKHALMVDALYNSLVTAKRQNYHRQIAFALKSNRFSSTQNRPELLAHHFTESGMLEESLEFWLAAGLRSQSEYANKEAVCQLGKGLELISEIPETPARDELELKFLTAIGSSFQAIRGYAAPEVGPAFARARDLCQKAGNVEQLFATLWGNWTWHLVRADLKNCITLTEEMMALAEYNKDRGMLMEAAVGQVVSRFFLGDFETSFNSSQDAINNYEDPEQTKLWQNRLGQNASAIIRCYSSLAQWHLGYPSQALETNQEMLALASNLEHPFSLAHGLHFTCWLHLYLGCTEKLLETSNRQIELSSEKGFEFWKATGIFFKGSSLLLDKKPEQALENISGAVEAFRSLAAVLSLTLQLCHLSETLMSLERYDEAARALKEGLDLAENNHDRAHQAELFRLCGELVLLSNSDQAAAENYFRKAIELAREQKSKAWELRSSVSLAKLLKSQGRIQEARDCVGPIYDSFTEGFDLPDQIAAKELLKSLA